MYPIILFFILSFPYIIFMNYPPVYEYLYTIPKAVFLIVHSSIIWLFLLYSWINKNINIKSNKDKINYVTGLLLIFVIVSSLSSVDFQYSFYGEEIRYEGLVAWLSYITFFLVTKYFIEPNQIKKLFKPLLLTSVLVSIYGILQHFLLDFLPRASGKEGWTRSYAFFDNPNFFGSYLVLMMFIGVSLYLQASTRKWQLLYLFCISVNFVALLYSFTRSAWLGTFVGMFIVTFFILLKRRELLKRWLLLIATFAIIFTFINFTENNQYLNRANTLLNDVNELIVAEDTGHAGSSRWYIWKTALPLVKDYFWLGSGPDTFALVFPHNKVELEEYFGNPNALVDKAHNEYLQIAVTMGVPALITYLLLLGTIVYSGFKALFNTVGNDQLYLIGFLAAIIGYAVQAFFNISVITVAPYFWIFLGMAYKLSITSNITDKDEMQC